MNDWRQKFLKSKAWRLLRAWVIERDMGICQLCGEYILDSPEVHHKIELTVSNYMNPSISLNPELLESLHHECHDRRHGRFRGKIKETIVDDDLNIDYGRR